MKRRLTLREYQVLTGLAAGMSNAALGRRLFLSEATIKSHAQQLFRKLGAANRTHAVALGFRSGLLSLFPMGCPVTRNVDRVTGLYSSGRHTDQLRGGTLPCGRNVRPRRTSL